MQIAGNESHVFHCLLPTKRDPHLTFSPLEVYLYTTMRYYKSTFYLLNYLLTDMLRSAKTYPLLRVRTTRFQNSFIPFALTNLQ